MMRRGGHVAPHSSEGARPGKFPAAPVEGGGGISASWGADGLEIRNTRPHPFWAKITGRASGTSRYSWVEVDEGDVDTFDATLSEDFAATGTSAEDGGPAYEINSATDVPTGTRVKMWPAGDGSYHLFTKPGSGLAGYEDPIDGSPLFAPSSSGISGWDEDTCLLLSVIHVSGRCAGIDQTQKHLLESDDGTTWTSETQFAHTGTAMSGDIVFLRSAPTPQLSIGDMPAFSLGPFAGGWLFELDGPELCGGTPSACGGYFTVSVQCVPCPVPSGTYSPPGSGALPLAIPSGSTRSTTIILPPQSGSPSGIHLCLSVPCVGGIRNLTVTLTAPDGTVYTLLANPGGVLAQEADFVLSPANGMSPIQSAVEYPPDALIGVYEPVDDFSAYTGTAVGVWLVSVTNSGPCAAELTCATLCYGAVATGLTLSSVASPDTGAAPLPVTIVNTITGSPLYTSIDYGDGSPLEWILGAGNGAHIYTGTDAFIAVVRVWSACGGFEEDTVTIRTNVVLTACCGYVEAELEVHTLGNGDFTGFDETATLTYDPMNDEWTGTVTDGVVTMPLVLTCTGSDPEDWELDVGGCVNQIVSPPSPFDCDPFGLTFAHSAAFCPGFVTTGGFTHEITAP
jgi:hypothetical protein